MRKKLLYIGGILFGVAGGLGIIGGAQSGIPSPWCQIASYTAIIISIILFKKHKRYGRVC